MHKQASGQWALAAAFGSPRALPAALLSFSLSGGFTGGAKVALICVTLKPASVAAGAERPDRPKAGKRDALHGIYQRDMPPPRHPPQQGTHTSTGHSSPQTPPSLRGQVKAIILLYVISAAAPNISPPEPAPGLRCPFAGCT